MANVFGANILGFAMLIFMLFSAYISEYSAVLLDTTEKSFYGALPIGHNEINTAKNIKLIAGCMADAVLEAKQGESMAKAPEKSEEETEEEE